MSTLRHIDLILIKQQNNLHFLKDTQVFVDFIAAFNSMKVNILLRRSFTSVGFPLIPMENELECECLVR